MQKELTHITCCLIDMDGTIYLSKNSNMGASLIHGAKEFLEYLDASNIRKIFLTNNSSKNSSDYVKKLSDLHIDVTTEQVFTSGEATRITLKNRMPNAKIYLLGTDSLVQEFKSDGFCVITEKNFDSFDKASLPDYVVLGFDTTLTYQKIHRACDYIRQGVPFIATHPDINCPLENNNYMPDTGAMIKLFEASTGISPEIIGKPYSHIIKAVLEKYSLKREELMMIGDRLYTDIQMAINTNISSTLVLSGETTMEDVKNSTIQPALVCQSVKELHELFIKATSL